MKLCILGYSTSKEDTAGLIARGLSRKAIYQEEHDAETLVAAIAATRGRLTALCVVRKVRLKVPTNVKVLDVSALPMLPCIVCGK